MEFASLFIPKTGFYPSLQYYPSMTRAIRFLPILCVLYTQQLQSQGNMDLFTASYSGIKAMTGQDSALQLLEDALLLMKKYPFRNDGLEWDSLRSSARSQLTQAKRCSDAHNVIDWCAQQLQLSHSFIMPPKNTAVYTNNTSSLQRPVHLREVTGEIRTAIADMGIGYISIPWMRSTDPVIAAQLADSLQACIRQLAAQGATRWIVDLRKNTGGNCWPMLAGIGPLLGNGVCGYFVREGGKQTAYHYNAGAIIYNGQSMCKASNVVELNPTQKQWIAVLTGPNTSSSGEILALAFKGMPNVRLIGEPTAGLTTANTTFNLLDGSMLVLTICREADRTGKICEGKIIPDDRLTIDPKSSEDRAWHEAIMWLQSM